MADRTILLLISAHICISIAGLIIHLKLHPPLESLYFLWASPVNLFSILVIPFLLARPSTVGWGFMMNAGVILTGTVGMAFFTLQNLESPVTFSWIISDTPLKGIILLWLKLPIALMILQKTRAVHGTRQMRGCRT